MNNAPQTPARDRPRCDTAMLFAAADAYMRDYRLWVPREEISIAMGHCVLSSTTEDYVIYDPDYLKGFRAGVDDLIADLTRAALHPKLTRNSDNASVLLA